MSEITVIVPVYKVEAYIHRCVDSILAQTFSDFDVILVDDGSPDNCPQICDKYTTKDQRVHVIHQKNGGPSIARNKGLDWAFENSTSKYLVFIDSDDCVHPQYLERLFNAVISNNAEIGMCRHKYISLSEPLAAMTLYETYHTKSVSAEDLMISEWSSFNYAWGKLYAKKCFRELRYPQNISFGEDNLIIFRAMFESNRIIYVNEILYYYFYNASGITKSPWTPRSLEVFTGIQVQLDYYAANGYERAHQKEIELYIQQCAYQIHRIRENRENLKKNKPYLIAMKCQMHRLFQENAAFRPQEVPYWYEALYPQKAAVRNLIVKLKRNLSKYGFAGTIRRVCETIFKVRIDRLC